ncbi:MAG: acyl carrier protein [bacterium]|nr:acyl carrier protein [bacterium]
MEAELKELIIGVLVLEDITPEEISSTDALFGEGLGLDSIDALEIAMGLEKRYEVQVGDDPEENAKHFANVRGLATFVSENRKK